MCYNPRTARLWISGSGPSCVHGFSIAAAYLSIVSAVAAGPIHDAVKTGDVSAIARALDTGADVSASGGTATALHYAVADGNMQAIDLLLAHGAKVDARSIWGLPPIQGYVG